MEISQVAKKSGVSASTLRFYEDKGLISSIGRQGIRRVFSPNVLRPVYLCCTHFAQQYIGSHIIENASDTILA